MFTASRDLYSSKTASGITSETYMVADAIAISMFLRGSPSTTTIQGSNATGSTVDITNTTADWSNLTTVISPSPDMLDIAPGFRYIRTLRSETTEVRIHVQNRVR